MRPAVAPKHRLAFNLRGFPPLEPAMAGIEPCSSSCCHGSLIEFTPDNYQKLWLSEGGGQSRPSYNQVIVDVIPYGETDPVKAIALQAAPHARLARDLPPSTRYMSLLVQGAQELGLEDWYTDQLRSVPTANPSRPLRTISLLTLVLYTTLFRLKLSGFTRWLSAVTTALTVSPRSPWILRTLSELTVGMFLLPSAALGSLILFIDKLTGRPLSPMLKAMWK